MEGRKEKVEGKEREGKGETEEREREGRDEGKLYH